MELYISNTFCTRSSHVISTAFELQLYRGTSHLNEPSASSSDGRTRNEEPLVVDAVNWCGFELLVSLNVARIGSFAIGRVVDGDIGAGIDQLSLLAI